MKTLLIIFLFALLILSKDDPVKQVDLEIAKCDSILAIIEGNILKASANEPASKHFEIDYRDFLVKKDVLIKFRQSLQDSTKHK